MKAGQVHFLLGGVRSGKSLRAEALAREEAGEVVYVATMATGDPLDGEMRERLAIHRSRRPPHWTTIENRFDLDAIFAENPGKPVLLDCLTMWLSWWCCQEARLCDEAILANLEHALAQVSVHGVRLIVVGNEIGMGLVPLGPENRAYRDLSGRANQLVARHADTVEFMVAGLPLRVK